MTNITKEKIEYETEKAYLVTIYDNEIWIPKSQVSWITKRGNVFQTINIPEWLARKIYS